MITKDIVRCIVGIGALCETLTCVGICIFLFFMLSFFNLFAFASFVLSGGRCFCYCFFLEQN